MRQQPKRKLEAHRKHKVAHEAKRARVRQQATAHKSTPPASQRGSKHTTTTSRITTPLKVWNNVRVANLGKRLDEVWQGIEQKINKLSPDFEEAEKAA